MRRETEVAIRAALLAQQMADSREGAGQITSKGGIDLVTATDVACEDAIRAELSTVFPGHSIIGEERGGEPVAGKPYWLVDPICGTRLFASNLPLYCHNIALIEESGVSVAAVGVGRSGEILFAEKGAGAWIRTAAGDRKLSVSDSSNAIWIDGDGRAAEPIRRAWESGRYYVWLYSSSVVLAHLADGRISGGLHFGEPATNTFGSEHFSAGCLVAEEAGALIMDFQTGKPWNLQTRSFLFAATPEVRDQLLSLI